MVWKQDGGEGDWNFATGDNPDVLSAFYRQKKIHMEMYVTSEERSIPPHSMPCQQSRCGLDIPDLTRVGVGSCSYDSDLHQTDVMSPLGEVDWRWGGRRGDKEVEDSASVCLHGWSKASRCV